MLRMRGNWAAGYRSPTYLTKDAEVIIPILHEGKWRGARCRVVVACGDAGRVVNEHHGIDKWVELEDMAVKDGDPLGRGPLEIKAMVDKIFAEQATA